MDDEIKKNQTGSYTIKSTTSLDDFNEYFDAELNDESLDTIGDLIIQRMGCLPKQGELVEIENFFFKIVHSDHRRIYLLELIKDSGSVISPVINPVINPGISNDETCLKP